MFQSYVVRLSLLSAMKNDYFQIRISEEEKRELSEAAELADIPAAQIVREATRRKVREIKRRHQPKPEPATA